MSPVNVRRARPGWPAMTLLSASVAVAFGTLLYAFSVLITEEAAGADFSTTTLSVAYGGAILIGGLLAIPVGRRADRRGVRGLVGTGAALGGAGLALLSVAQQPWQVVAASWAFVGPAGAMTFYEPAFVAVDQWFGSRQRARALALLTVVGGLAGPVFIPLTTGLVAAFGWRTAAVTLGSVLAVTGIATAATALPPSTPELRGPPDVAVPAVGTLMRSTRFLLYSAGILLMFGSMQAVLFHRIAAFEESGWSVAVISFWAAMSGLLGFSGRFAAPFLADRFGSLRVNWAVMAAVTATVSLMIEAAATWQMVLHFALFGPAFGALLPLRAAVMSEWYSGPRYGRIMGLQWTFVSLAGAAGPAGVGILRDLSGGYLAPLAVIVAALALATALTAASGRAAAAAS